MKKRFLAILLVVMLVMQTLPVLAGETAVSGDVALTLMGELEGFKDVQTVNNLNYLRYRGDSGYGLMTVEGTPITAPIYRSFFYPHYGCIEVALNVDGLNVNGLLDQDGAEVMPCEYGDTKVLNNYWALGFVLESCSADNYDYKGTNTYYLITRVDVYWLPTATCVAQLTRDQYVDADDAGRNIIIKNRETEVITVYDSSFNVLVEEAKNMYSSEYGDYDYIIIKENGQQGLADREGNVLVKPMFKYLNTNRGDFYTVSTGDTNGLVQISTGEVVVPAEYEKIETTSYSTYDAAFNSSSTFVAGKYVLVVKDGKMGYVDLNGNVTCEPKYSDKVIQEKYGAALYYSDLEGIGHFLAADGVDSALDYYYRINPLYGGNGFLFEVKNDDYDCGIIDWHGNTWLETEYERIGMTGDGKYILAEKVIDRVSHYELYEVSYPFDTQEQQGDLEESSEESADEPEESTTESEESSSSGGLFGGLFGNKTPKDESSVAEESSVVEESSAPETAGVDKAAVSALVNSMITLLKADAAGNQATVTTLIDTALASCASDDTLTTLLNTAKTLLAADASSAITLLESVVAMLK